MKREPKLKIYIERDYKIEKDGMKAKIKKLNIYIYIYI